MIFAFIVLLPILAVSLWWFGTFSPRDADKHRVRQFNIAVLIAGALICTGVTLRIQGTLADTPDRAWWPVLSAIVSLLVLPLWLAACGVVRNLLVFRAGQGSRRDE